MDKSMIEKIIAAVCLARTPQGGGRRDRTLLHGQLWQLHSNRLWHGSRDQLLRTVVLLSQVKYGGGTVRIEVVLGDEGLSVY